MDVVCVVIPVQNRKLGIPRQHNWNVSSHENQAILQDIHHYTFSTLIHTFLLTNVVGGGLSRGAVAYNSQDINDSIAVTMNNVHKAQCSVG